MKVYLAGPINGATDAECNDWRAEATRVLQDVLNPMLRDYRGREGHHSKELVLADKQDIMACDAVLAYCPKPSVGTSMEVLFAWMNHIRVVAVVPDVERASPWLREHAELVSSLGEALAMLGG